MTCVGGVFTWGGGGGGGGGSRGLEEIMMGRTIYNAT